MQKFELFKQYIDEISQYTPHIQVVEQTVRMYFRELTTHPDYIWLDISNESERVGFVILDSHPQHADWHIIETFIAPDHRRQGYMSSALQAFIDAHPGKYSLYILHNNMPAQHFWRFFFKSVNYIEEDFDGRNDEYGKDYAFAPATPEAMS